MLATWGQAAPGLFSYGALLLMIGCAEWWLQRAARGKRWPVRLGIIVGQLALLVPALWFAVALVIYLNAIGCPPGEGSVGFTDCPGGD
jgi:hypothetical protein